MLNWIPSEPAKLGKGPRDLNSPNLNPSPSLTLNVSQNSSQNFLSSLNPKPLNLMKEVSEPLKEIFRVSKETLEP